MGDEEEEGEEEDEAYPAGWPHPAEDRFMKLSEMERFLLDAEAKAANGGDGGSDSEGDDDDMDGEGEDEDDEGGEVSVKPAARVAACSSLGFVYLGIPIRHRPHLWTLASWPQP